MSWLAYILKTAVKAAIFAIPVAFVADWAGIPATWKSVAFVLFCMVWSDAIDTATDRPAPASKPNAAEATAKPALPVLTPAEVAFEARKLAPRPLRQG